MGTVIFILIGILFIFFGFYCRKAKKPVGFWSNVECPPMIEEKQYNRKVGNLWIMYGCSFFVFSLPLSAGQNSGWVVITVLGVVFMTLLIMVLYSQIEAIHRKDK